MEILPQQLPSIYHSTDCFWTQMNWDPRTDWFSKPLDSPTVSVTGASYHLLDQGKFFKKIGRQVVYWLGHSDTMGSLLWLPGQVSLHHWRTWLTYERPWCATTELHHIPNQHWFLLQVVLHGRVNYIFWGQFELVYHACIYSECLTTTTKFSMYECSDSIIRSP